jgi:chromosome segregation ATPase
LDTEDKDLDTEGKDLETEGKELEKYEDKYLTDIRRMEKNYIFNEQELEIIKEQKSAFLKMVDDTEKEIEELKSKLSLQQQNEFQICGKGYIMPQEEPTMNCIHSAKEEINERIKRMNDILKSKDTA